ncbi:Cellulose synthase catalytic subunit [UDP-forming] [hydrothermal vent metagenome]|uniref:Cellulose synthase catalytic subunit [UDP-forming] n=1 Tax=hydrothermal vent metagenome TaxID=652676 RepID=A0A1W1D4Y6_9ZZZZ
MFIELFHKYRFFRYFIGLFVLITLYILITSQYYIQTQFVLAYGTIIFLFILLKLKKIPEFLVIFIKFLAVVIVLRYLYWRITSSISYEGFFDYIGALLLLFAEMIAITIYLLGIFTSMNILKRQPIDLKGYKKKEYPTVDVLIPTYNEPIDMCEKTILAALAFDYPKEKFHVYLCDDGGTDQKCNDKDEKKAKEARLRRKTLQEFCQKVGATYITRKKNEHAKAGNLNSALQYIHGDLLLILDTDHIPAAQFLQRTVGWFLKDEKMFLVQTPHAFYNADPIERNLRMFGTSISENDMFYKYILLGHDFWESAFFCGSAALLRRKYIDEVGGIVGDTITEDAETAITLHGLGYKSAYISEPMIRGLQAEDFASLVLQRVRWTQGMVQIFMMKNPFLSKKLKWYQKISYMSASFFWFFAFSRVIFFIAPLMYMIFGLKIYDANTVEMFAYVVPHIIMAVMMSFFLYAKVRNPFFSEIYETALSFFTLPAIIETIFNPREPTFKVTPKGTDISKTYVSELAIPFVVMFIIVSFAFIFGIVKVFLYPNELSVIVMTLFWNFINLLLLVTAIAVTSEKSDVRRYIRVLLHQKCKIFVDGKKYKGKIIDISEGGVSIHPKNPENKEKILKNAHNISIEILDINQKPFRVPAKFLKSIGWGKTLIFEFKDIEENYKLRQKLILLIYGNTTIWDDFDASHKVMNPVQSFVFIVKQSFKNALFKEAFLLTLHHFMYILKKRKG